MVGEGEAGGEGAVEGEGPGRGGRGGVGLIFEWGRVATCLGVVGTGGGGVVGRFMLARL